MGILFRGINGEDRMKQFKIDQANMTEEELEEVYDKLYSLKKTNGRKSLAPLFIYLILTEESSSDRHLSLSDIGKSLSEMPYEIELERKAIGRIVHNLADSGLGIFSMRGYGTWYDSDRELW